MQYFFRTHFSLFSSHLRIFPQVFPKHCVSNDQQSISSSIRRPHQYLRVQMTSTKFLKYPVFSITFSLLNKEGQRIWRDHVTFFSTALEVVYCWILVWCWRNSQRLCIHSEIDETKEKRGKLCMRQNMTDESVFVFLLGIVDRQTFKI
jgi:hypothetical protein